MNKNFKTIAVLQETDSVFINVGRYKNKIYHPEIQKDTILLEAYLTLEQAVIGLDEEILTCINEIIFKNCKVCRFKVFYDLADEDPIEFFIEYTCDGRKLYRRLYSIVLINLVK